MKTARPGKSVSHQPVKMYSRPVAIICPQVGIETGIPMPRKVSDASEIIDDPSSILPKTIAVSMTLGTICLAKIRDVLPPSVSTATINSFFRNAKTLARICRVYGTHPVIPRTRITLNRLEPSTAIKHRAIKINGNDSIISTIRIITASIHPPKKPARSPSVTPITRDTTTAKMPTISANREPCISRLKMSRPISSVPSRYVAVPPSHHTGGISLWVISMAVGSCGSK